MADAGTTEPAKPAKPEALPPSGISRDKIIDAATGKPVKGKILRPRRRSKMTGKQGLMTIGFKLFAFLFLWGGLQLYRTIFPTMDGSFRMSDAYRSWPLLERSTQPSLPAARLAQCVNYSSSLLPYQLQGQPSRNM